MRRSAETSARCPLVWHSSPKCPRSTIDPLPPRMSGRIRSPNLKKQFVCTEKVFLAVCNSKPASLLRKSKLAWGGCPYRSLLRLFSLRLLPLFLSLFRTLNLSGNWRLLLLGFRMWLHLPPPHLPPYLVGVFGTHDARFLRLQQHFFHTTSSDFTRQCNCRRIA